MIPRDRYVVGCLLLLTSCNTFEDLEREHPFTISCDDCDPADDGVGGQDVDTGSSTITPDAAVQRDIPAPPDLSASTTLDLGGFALLIADTMVLSGQPCMNNGNAAGPTIGGVTIASSSGGTVGFGGVLLTQGATTDQVQTILGVQTDPSQCGPSAPLGCGGYFAVALSGVVPLSDTLVIEVSQLGPQCNVEEIPYVVAVCSIQSSLSNQNCVGQILTQGTQGSASFPFDVAALNAP